MNNRWIIQNRAASFSGRRPHFRAAHNADGTAFSLIELMVAVALMSFIMLGLFAMFSQTQKAFKASMTQTDVLEAGRLTSDMLGREMSQMAAARMAYSTNFFAELSPLFSPPLLQGMPGTTLAGAAGTQDRRTNVVQRIFFLQQYNQAWNGIGYEVLPDYANGGVGTLYRFVQSNNRDVNLMSSNFLYAVRIATQGKTVTNLNRIMDGVVHFRVRVFSTNGYPLVQDPFLRTTNAVFYNNLYTNATYPYLPTRNTVARSAMRDEVDCYFMSNALPAYLELEVGVLESHILDRYRAIGGPIMPPAAALQQAQYRYLSNHVAQVHIFRHRIPIRTVDFTAYQ